MTGVDTPYTTATTPAIIDNTVVSIAANVLSTAADATQGLKVPTWHIGTNTSSVSVGVDASTIYDITGLAGTDHCTWVGDDLVFADTFTQIVYQGPHLRQI